MPRDIINIGADLDLHLKKTRIRVEGQVREAVTEAHRIAASGTPVDTGEARSNWRGVEGSLGTPRVIPPYSPGKKLGIAETANLEASSKQCKKAVKNWKPFDENPFHIFNVWPLIVDLNAGSISKQGRRFYERALSALSTRLKNLK